MDCQNILKNNQRNFFMTKGGAYKKLKAIVNKDTISKALEIINTESRIDCKLIKDKLQDANNISRISNSTMWRLLKYGTNAKYVSLTKVSQEKNAPGNKKYRRFISEHLESIMHEKIS